MTHEDVIKAARATGVENYGPTNMAPAQYARFVGKCKDFYDIAFRAGMEHAAQPDMVLIPQEVIDKIEQWSRAYSTDVFPEPDFEKVHAALKAAGISIDSVSASNMRHVITKVWEMIAAAPNLRQTSGKARPV